MCFYWGFTAWLGSFKDGNPLRCVVSVHFNVTQWDALTSLLYRAAVTEITIKTFANYVTFLTLQVRNTDIPMLDPYREEMMDKNFNTFSFGGHLNFEAYVQYEEYGGFTKAMDTLRSMKLMLKGEDGKAVACNIKVGRVSYGCVSLFVKNTTRNYFFAPSFGFSSNRNNESQHWLHLSWPLKLQPFCLLDLVSHPPSELLTTKGISELSCASLYMCVCKCVFVWSHCCCDVADKQITAIRLCCSETHSSFKTF